MDAVATHKLTKRYGQFEALRELDLHVAPGRLFGFLGPNGAGKTTTLRILLGLLRATSGRASLLGEDVWRAGPKLRRRVGYLPGDVRFYDHLTGRDTLDFINATRRANAGDEIRRLTDVFGLDLGKRVRDYSRGMKQKLGLIAVMMHRPELLILDEPTTALDPLIREVLYAELRQVATDGRTVLFSSHTLAEVEALCDEVAILRGGELIEQEQMDVLRARAVRHVEIRFQSGSLPPGPLPPGLELHRQRGNYLQAAWSGEMNVLSAWVARCDVQDVTIAPPDLDDLFLTYYRDVRGGGA